MRFACIAWGFRRRLIECCDRHFSHVTGSDHALLNARIRGWSALDKEAILFIIFFIRHETSNVEQYTSKQSKNTLLRVIRISLSTQHRQTYYMYKKLSYRRESAHVTSLNRTVQRAFRYVEPFTRGSRVCEIHGGQTDGRTDSNIAL